MPSLQLPSQTPTAAPEVAGKSGAQERVGWVDLARGIGIFLVVLGHVLRGLTSASIAPKGGFLAALDEWIYAFHMPVFFALSGLFAGRLVKRSWPELFADRWRVVIYPYLVWSILQTLVQIAFGRFTNNSPTFSDLLWIFVLPYMQFWFLYALLLVSLLYVALVKAKVPTWAIATLSLLLFLLPEQGAILLSPVVRGFKGSFVYYFLGAAVSLHVTSWRPAPASALFGAGLLFAAVTAIVGFWPSGNPLRALIAAGSGMTATMLLAMSLPASRFGLLRRWGELSLEIFVAHTLAGAAFRIFLQKVAGIDNLALHLVGGTLAGLTLPMVLASVCKRIGFEYAFTLRSRARPNMTPAR
jgi:fucose 4-O-acetylase-like acetyltransferase